MKLKFIIIGCLATLLASCSNGSGEVEQKQHDIFPLPCKRAVRVDGYKRFRAYYVDKEGKEIASLSATLEKLDPNYSFEPDFFQDGLLNVDVRTPEGWNRVFVDEKGAVVLDMKQVITKLGMQNIEYVKYSDFSHGLCFVETVKGKDFVYTAINKTGEVVFKLPFCPISSFNDKGQAYCHDLSGHIGIFSDKGEVLVAPAENVVHSGITTSGHLSETLPPVEDAVLKRGEDGKFTLYDYSGKALSAAMTFKFFPDANGCCVVPATENGGTYGIINKEGTLLCKTDFRQLKNDGKWYWFENANHEYGWIDKNGEVKVGPLKLSSMQVVHSRVDGYPHPFYGGEYSVGTTTHDSSDGDYIYRAGCLTVSDLRELKEKYDEYEPYCLISGNSIGIIALSPVVNGVVIGFDVYDGEAHIYKVKGKDLVPVNKDNGFIPASVANGFNSVLLYGSYALNPGSHWRGIR